MKNQKSIAVANIALAVGEAVESQIQDHASCLLVDPTGRYLEPIDAGVWCLAEMRDIFVTVWCDLTGQDEEPDDVVAMGYLLKALEQVAADIKTRMKRDLGIDVTNGASVGTTHIEAKP